MPRAEDRLVVRDSSLARLLRPRLTHSVESAGALDQDACTAVRKTEEPNVRTLAARHLAEGRRGSRRVLHADSIDGLVVFAQRAGRRKHVAADQVGEERRDRLE
jgi:hypothetical protein